MSDTPIYDQLMWEQMKEKLPWIRRDPGETMVATDPVAIERFRESMRSLGRSMAGMILQPAPPSPEYFEPRSADDIFWKHGR